MTTQATVQKIFDALQFVPNFSTKYSSSPSTAHAQGHTFTWTKLHQNAFESLQKTLTSNSVIAHFNPSTPTQFRVDASPVGLVAILTQTHGDETRPVAYASRTLTPVERRYSQTEREALAVVWGCERFRLYLYGQPSTSIQITSLLKLSTVPHRNSQRESNGGAFVCNRTYLALSIHLELIILRTYFLVCQ